MTLARWTALSYAVALALAATDLALAPGEGAARTALVEGESAAAATRLRLDRLEGLARENGALEARWARERTFLPSPEDATDARLVREIQQACDAAQVHVTEFVTRDRFQKHTFAHGELEEGSISVAVEGHYAGLVAALRRLESSELWLVISGFTIAPARSPADESSPLLSATFEVKTYCVR